MRNYFNAFKAIKASGRRYTERIENILQE